MTYRIRFTRQAQKDVEKLTPKLREKLKSILRNQVAVAPHSGKPLVGELKEYYSIRLSFKDRIVHTIQQEELIVLAIRARTHYGN